MGQTDATFLRHDSGGHRRGQVVDNNHHIDGMVVEELIELSHHLTGNLVETSADHTEIILRTVDLKVVEERGFERRIVGTAGIDQQTGYLGALVNGSH